MHVAGTFDGRRMCLYVDGVSKKSLTNGGSIDERLATAWFTRKADGTPGSRKVAVVSSMMGAVPHLPRMAS